MDILFLQISFFDRMIGLTADGCLLDRIVHDLRAFKHISIKLLLGGVVRPGAFTQL